MSTTDPNSSIRYTLDGSEPSAASSMYTGPVNIAATTVVRAACFSSVPGVPSSFLETNTYFINDVHTTAVLSIAGDQLGNLLNGNAGLQPFGSFEYFGPDGQLRDEATGQFNKHGNDSWAYNQRGFDYIARDQTGYNDAIHYPIFHSTPRDQFQRLIIKAAANDNYPFEPGSAHIRDAYVHSLAQYGHLKLDTRSCEPCVLYVNGQYWGVYEIREKVDDHDYTKEYYDQDEYDLQYLKTWGGHMERVWWTASANGLGCPSRLHREQQHGRPTAFAYVESQYNWKALWTMWC